MAVVVTRVPATKEAIAPAAQAKCIFFAPPALRLKEMIITQDKSCTAPSIPMATAKGTFICTKKLGEYFGSTSAIASLYSCAKLTLRPRTELERKDR